MLSRRELLAALAALTATTTIPSPVSAEHHSQPRSEPGGSSGGIHFGAQTNAWTIDPNNLDSLFDVLAQVRKVGYEGFETGYFNLPQAFASPASARARFEATGLVFFGVHMALPYTKSVPAKTPPGPAYQDIAPASLALGAKHLIVSGSPSTTPDDTRNKIAALNSAGEFCQKLGLPLAYHNHEWEFDPKAPEMESLFAQTDPSTVHFLLDAGHAFHGGADVPALLRKHYDRIIGLHLRDYRDGRLVTLGQGTFPLAEVAAILKSIQWQGWVLNEEDGGNGGPKLGLQVIEPAYQAMHAAFAS